jgi:flagellar motor switch protein FliM
MNLADMSLAGMSVAGSVKLKIDENNQIIWLLYPFSILKKIKPLLDNKLFIWHASCWVKFYAHDY